MNIRETFKHHGTFHDWCWCCESEYDEDGTCQHKPMCPAPSIIARYELMETTLKGIVQYASLCQGTDIERVLYIANQGLDSPQAKERSNP